MDTPLCACGVSYPTDTVMSPSITICCLDFFFFIIKIRDESSGESHKRGQVQKHSFTKSLRALGKADLSLCKVLYPSGQADPFKIMTGLWDF